MFSKTSIFLCLLFLSHELHSQTVKKEIVFAVVAPGSPPYLFFDNSTGQYEGVIVDLFRKYQDSVNVEFIDSSRARIENFVSVGIADTFLSSPNWLNSPDSLSYSTPILKHRSFLYRTRPFKKDFSLLQMAGTHICARRGYTYPILEPLFAQKKLFRVDSSSQKIMAEMLAKGRCDAAVMNEHNAKSAFYVADYCDIEIYQSATFGAVVNQVLVLKQQPNPIKAFIDPLISDFIDSGELEKSMLFHTQGLSFPKAKSC